MDSGIYKKLTAVLGSDLKRDEPLLRHTNFRIGGPADYFFTAKTCENLVKAAELARELNLPYFILGGGSNILVLDGGIRGLVIKTANKELKIKNNLVEVETGYIFMELANKLAEQGLSGLEFATGIYGTVGGAIRGNAGSYGVEIKDVLQSCRVWIPLSGKRNYTNRECQFVYRGSIFKEHPDWLILSAVFDLELSSSEEVKKKIKDIAKKKYGAQPLQYPSSGCIFKNPSLSEAELSKFSEHFDDFSEHNFWQSRSISAGYLIEKTGLKGKSIGGAEVSEQHASFIINKGGATAQDVITLISLIKQQVRDKYGIQLAEEIQIVGEN